MKKMIARAGSLLRVPETDEQPQCVACSKVRGNFVQFGYQCGWIFRGPERMPQLIEDIIIEAEVRKRKTFFKNRGLGKESEGSALNSIRRNEKDFSVAPKNCPCNMSIGLFGEGN